MHVEYVVEREKETYGMQHVRIPCLFFFKFKKHFIKHSNMSECIVYIF